MTALAPREEPRTVDQGLRYRPGLQPCKRCGHRRDMHEAVKGLQHCRVCDYLAYRLPCSTARLREDAVLDALGDAYDGND